MTQEEKAKAYDEALEKIHRFIDGYSRREISKEELEDIFPELAESEDERNIKDLIDELKCSLRAANCQNDACGGGHEKRIALLEWGIAWLKKQSQVKESIISQHENKSCKENDDSLISEDEKIRKELITYFKNLSDVYSLEPLEINPKKAITWLEKQGETDNQISVPKFTFDDVIALQYAMETVREDKDLYKQLTSLHDRVHEALKSKMSRNLLGVKKEDERIRKALIDGFTVMKESKNCGKTFSNHNIPVVDILAWLKSLEDRLQPQPKWSEEDEEYINDLLKYFSQNEKLKNTKEDIVIWLKSLRRQNMWKPSDEQMEALTKALSLAKNCGEEYSFDIRTLYDQLKKLKGE